MSKSADQKKEDEHRKKRKIRKRRTSAAKKPNRSGRTGRSQNRKIWGRNQGQSGVTGKKKGGMPKGEDLKRLAPKEPTTKK